MLAQNINPIMGVLKAEEHGHLPADRIGPLTVTGVMYDTTDVEARFSYLAAPPVQNRAPDPADRDLRPGRQGPDRAAGIPHSSIDTVPNGLDVIGFEQRLTDARHTGMFATVVARNHLPATGTMVLMSPRRVVWKGHHELIDAVQLLASVGSLDSTS